MKLDKEKLKRIGKTLVSSTKEAATIAAPALVGAGVSVAGHPELGTTIVYTTPVWAGGYTGYHYMKYRKAKKHEK